MIMEWVRERAKEISTKIGLMLAAVSGAASLASTLSSPWNYLAFGSAILLVLFPEK